MDKTQRVSNMTELYDKCRTSHRSFVRIASKLSTSPSFFRIFIVIAAMFFVCQANKVRGEVGSPQQYLITDYGAIGDGKTLNTAAVQNTIDKCAATGGGTVVVPNGTFLTGSIFLKQGVNLRVEKGGILKGTINPADYPQINTRWEGIERRWTAALVNADGLNDLEISGEGVIDGSGDEWLRQSIEQNQRPDANASAPVGKPRLIGIQNSRHVRIKQLNLRNQAIWGLHILYCDNVTIDGLTIRAEHNIPSSDGIDIDSSRHVRIRHTDIDVNDDCISIKSGRDADGLRVNRPSEDIIIENCRFGYGHGAVTMGSETSGGIRRVTVRDCVVEAGNWAAVRFKTQPSRGGIVENIVFRNIELRGVNKAFEMNMAWTSSRGVLGAPAAVLPIFRKIQLINVSGTSETGGIIRGLKDSPVDNVKFRNCRLTATKDLVVENATNIDRSGLKINFKATQTAVH